MKRKHAVAAANKKAMREGYRAVEDALQSLTDQAQDLRMGYEPDRAMSIRQAATRIAQLNEEYPG